MRSACGRGVAGWAVLAVLVLSACSDDEGDVASADGCSGDPPVVAFDHETTDPERGIGGGVPEVSVLSAGGDIEMVTGSWVASQAAFSPSGEHLVVVRAEGDYESAGPSSTALWVLGADGAAPRELTGGRVLDEDPDWSADGSSIVFARASIAGPGYTWSIATVPAEGGEAAELFSTRDGDRLDKPEWSPDGRRIAFVRSVYTVGAVETAVWTMAADGGGAQPLAELPYVESLDWHPDGTSLLVATSGPAEETYLVDAGTGETELLGTGARLATWSPDGRGVYYFRSVDQPRVAEWRIVEGRVEDGSLTDDRTVLARDDLDGTVLADVALYPGFSLAVGPCG